MYTLTIEILNEKAINLLRDLESLKLIRVMRDINEPKPSHRKMAKYKGSMTKQTVSDIDQQLDELRNSWE